VGGGSDRSRGSLPGRKKTWLNTENTGKPITAGYREQAEQITLEIIPLCI